MLADERVEILADAARSRKPVKGLTHNFYRYPARFSPDFAATAIRLFSNPSDVVYDPYMGGGTTVVEAMVSGRDAIGGDLNSLAVFVAKVKTTLLAAFEKEAIQHWGQQMISQLKYDQPLHRSLTACEQAYTYNLGLHRARFIKKVVALALNSLEHLPSKNARNFVRCALLRTTQWALDGKRTHASVAHFRERLGLHLADMLDALTEYEKALPCSRTSKRSPIIIEGDAANIDGNPLFSGDSPLVDLVVTSPPYPGLHVLYHRWQVDGRKETPAPYWIIGCRDGKGESHYNFGGRHRKNLESYFAKSLATLKAIRAVMRAGAYMIQMIAFADVAQYLPAYLANMEAAGFEESKNVRDTPNRSAHRIWRTVPNRRWHANLKGMTSGSREVVLIHRAV